MTGHRVQDDQGGHSGVGDGCVTVHMKIELENLISRKSYFQLQVRDGIFWCCNLKHQTGGVRRSGIRTGGG
jgi:hypothetical protein